MAMARLCAAEELQRGEMTLFEHQGRHVLVAWPDAGEPAAFDDSCPHQGISLADGYLDEGEIVCAAHQWSFDAQSGAGIDPPGCGLTRFPLRVEGAEVLVDLGDA